MTKSIQRKESQCLSLNWPIYAFICLPCVHISNPSSRADWSFYQHIGKIVSWSQHNELVVYGMFHEGYPPTSRPTTGLSWQQKLLQCTEALGCMSDLYGWHCAVSDNNKKKKDLTGWMKSDSFRTQGGEWVPGTAGTCLSIFDWFNWRRFSANSQEIPGMLPPWTTGADHVTRLSSSTSRLIYGYNSVALTQQRNKKTGT